MKSLLIQLNQRPIAVYPIYIKITGSVNAGLLLSQLMYWNSAVNGRVFYKSDAEIMEETMLSESELRAAKNKLKSMDFINIKAKGVPARTHYDINLDLLIREINDFSSVKSTKLKKRNQQNCNSEINETITENTTENKTKNTTDIICEKEFSPLEEPKIKNSFTRQSLATDLNASSSDSVLSPEAAPNSTYSAFSAFCSTYERLAAVTYPTNENGNYIMAAKDGANTKKLVTWLRKVSKSEASDEELMTQFITAAWHISDKWLKANFTISVIFGQCNNIYTKYMYNNPISKEKRKQEEIDRLVNEFEG